MKAWCDQNDCQVVMEYRDEGVSATDDNRPQFQKMLADISSKPKPFDVIVVYNLSRLYRNHLKLGELRFDLKKNRIMLKPITQLVPEDDAGELMLSQFALFDEYSSRLNGTNTLRCMIQNAERGYFNGSSVPFGYQLHYTDIPARMGVKKTLEINQKEAKIVKHIFNLYLARNLGVKGIASHLNEKGILRRGELWSNTGIYQTLTNTVYKGEKRFNQRDSRTRDAKDESQVIKIPVKAIVSEEQFELVAIKLEQRSPKRTHPRRLSSPRLLTGLLSCGECGAAMTLATGTGTGGTYNYYRCTTKSKKSVGLCSSKSVPLEKFDRTILDALAQKIFTPDRVATIILEFKTRMNNGDGMDIKDLNKQLKIVQHKIDKLYEAIENDCIALDEDTKARMEEHKAKRTELAAKIANYRMSPTAIADTVTSAEVDKWTELLREKLLDTTGGFSKDYLKLLINKIVVTGKEVKVTGDPRAMVGAIRMAVAEKKNPIAAEAVIGFNSVWRAL